MGLFRPLLGLAFFLGAAAPSNAFPLEEAEIGVGGGLVQIHLTYVYEGAVAQRVRQAIDGDSNGEVTRAEVRAFEAEFTAQHSAEPECLAAVAGLRWGDRAPAALQRVDSFVHDGPGPALRTSALRQSFLFLFAFELGESKNITFNGLDVAGLHARCRPSGDRKEVIPVEGFAWDGYADGRSPATPKVTIRGLYSETIDSASIPAVHEPAWKGDRFEAEGEAGRDLVHAGLVFRLNGDPYYVPGTVLPLPVRLSPWFFIGAAATAAAGYLAWAFRFSWFGLFSRLSEDHVLDHPLRRRLLEAIASQPGVHLNELKKRLGRAHGTLVYHLATLHRHRQVRAVREGGRARFYLPHHRVLPALSPLQAEILRAVAASPGIDQTALLRLLGGGRHRLSAQTRRMAAKGLLTARREGRWKRYYLPSSFDAAV